MVNEPTCVSLFSGIGGLDAGLRRAGFRHLLMCESDPWRREVLRARFPGMPVASDVCALREREPARRGAADPVCAAA
ncbi:MAG: DNA cytosine methyltransferase, partial [Solirubrobacterales bacterium]